MLGRSQLTIGLQWRLLLLLLLLDWLLQLALEKLLRDGLVIVRSCSVETRHGTLSRLLLSMLVLVLMMMMMRWMIPVTCALDWLLGLSVLRLLNTRTLLLLGRRLSLSLTLRLRLLRRDVLFRSCITLYSFQSGLDGLLEHLHQVLHVSLAERSVVKQTVHASTVNLRLEDQLARSGIDSKDPAVHDNLGLVLVAVGIVFVCRGRLLLGLTFTGWLLSRSSALRSVRSQQMVSEH